MRRIALAVILALAAPVAARADTPKPRSIVSVAIPPGMPPMRVKVPVKPGDKLAEAISGDPLEYVSVIDDNTLMVKLYGSECSHIVGFSEAEIYNYEVCPNGTAHLTE